MKIFNYSTFGTQLDKLTRTLYINFYPESQSGILETLFELESLLSWCRQRVEIHSLLIASPLKDFDLNFSPDQLSTFDGKKIEKIHHKIFDLCRSLLELPQQVIIDLGKKPSSWAFQLSLGADCRLLEQDAELIINPQQFGLPPIAGMLGLSNELFGHHHAQALFFKNQCLAQYCLQHAFVQGYHQRKRSQQITQLLSQIFSQAPIARIQAKLACNQRIINKLADFQKSEQMCEKVSFLSEDWRQYPKDHAYTPAQHLGYIVQFLKKNHASKKEGFKTTKEVGF